MKRLILLLFTLVLIGFGPVEPALSSAIFLVVILRHLVELILVLVLVHLGPIVTVPVAAVVDVLEGNLHCSLLLLFLYIELLREFLTLLVLRLVQELLVLLGLVLLLFARLHFK